MFMINIIGKYIILYITNDSSFMFLFDVFS